MATTCRCGCKFPDADVKWVKNLRRGQKQVTKEEHKWNNNGGKAKGKGGGGSAPLALTNGDADEAKVEVARRCRALAPLMERHCGQGSSAGLLLAATALDA